MMALCGCSPETAPSIRYSKKMIARLGCSRIRLVLMQQVEGSIVTAKMTTASFGFCQSYAPQKVEQHGTVSRNAACSMCNPCILDLDILDSRHNNMQSLTRPASQLPAHCWLRDDTCIRHRLARPHHVAEPPDPSAMHLDCLLQTRSWRCWLGPEFLTPVAHCCLAGTVLHAAATGPE